ncbi:MAG: hypothetical protein OQK24_01430 [Magnetovibrio sp.]|nr:hypothetical protein [Magnetovibrio sp.]
MTIISKSSALLSLLNSYKHRYINRARYFTVRKKAEHAMLDFAKDASAQKPRTATAKKVLIDGTWDNPNFWFRLNLTIPALGLENTKKEGLLGHFARPEVRGSFSRFGIEVSQDLAAIKKTIPCQRARARELLNQTQTPDDMLEWELPGGVPGGLLYDSLLKWMRKGVAELDNPKLEKYVARALTQIETSKRVIENTDADLLIASHAIGVEYGSLAWFAIKKGIDIACLYGDFGSQRFLRITDTDQLFTESHVPARDEFFSLDQDKRDRLAELGYDQLIRRISGQTNDIGAQQAYLVNNTNITREDILKTFNWSPDKPIICVYAQNWFDFPRYLGLDSFRDFYDWIQVTLAAAHANTDVNWLFKSHPCDRIYNIPEQDQLKTMLKVQPADNIGYVPEDWNGQKIMESIDGAVTCTGSIGFEFPAQGKPVLLAERGWYGHLDVGVTSKSREDYIRLLGTSWWDEFDTNQMPRHAKQFLGWYFCLPDWQKTCIFNDDSGRQDIYFDVEEFINTHKDSLNKEIETIRKWFDAGDFRYHVFKIKTADGYQMGNIL